MQSGECTKAISEYTQAIRLEPTFATAYFSRGLAWATKGETDHAINDYSQAIQLDPTLSSAYLQRATEWDNKGEFDKAISDYTQAIRLEPTSGSLHTERELRGQNWANLTKPSVILTKPFDSTRNSQGHLLGVPTFEPLVPMLVTATVNKRSKTQQ